MKKNFLVTLSFMVCLLILPLALLANEGSVVIDPGHGPNETDNSGGAFTVDWLGSELSESAEIGSVFVQVVNTDYFSDTDGYRILLISDGNNSETAMVLPDDNGNDAGVNYNTNEIFLESPLQHSYPAGASVTVQGFRIQALGYPRGTTNYANHTTHSHTHEVPASEWRDWDFMERSNGEPMGLLEYKIAWEVATRLQTLLPANWTTQLTKNDVMDTATFQQRGTTGTQPDFFISLHTNASDNLTARGTEFVPFKSYRVGEVGDWRPTHAFEPTWWTNFSHDGDNFDFSRGVETHPEGDTPLLLSGYQYHVHLDKSAIPVIPHPVRYRASMDQAPDGTYFQQPALVDVIDTNAGGAFRNDEGNHYRIPLTTPFDSGPATLELRGPFQSEEQMNLGNHLIQPLGEVVPGPVRNGGLGYANCEDVGACNSALASWVADVSDDHEPAYALLELEFHTNPAAQEFFISGGYDSVAVSISEKLPGFEPEIQEVKYAAGRDNPHPFIVTNPGHRIVPEIEPHFEDDDDPAQPIRFNFYLKYDDSVPVAYNPPLFSSPAYASSSSGGSFDPSEADYQVEVEYGDTGTISPFEPDDYQVFAEQVNHDQLECPVHWDHFFSPEYIESLDLTEFDFEGSPFITREYQFQRQSRVSGDVFDSPAMVPVTGAEVTLMDDLGNSWQTVTTDEGQYHFCGLEATGSSGNSPGGYTVEVDVEGDTLSTEISQVDQGEIVWADTLYLQDEGPLTGKTKNVSSNRGKKDFLMEFDLQGNSLSQQIQSEAYGNYNIDLAHGTYQVSISFDEEEVGYDQVDFKDTTYTFVFPDDAQPDGDSYVKDFYVEPYAGVKGRVYDSISGEKVADVDVELFDTAWQSVKSTNTAEHYGSGYYIMQRFDDGIYHMRAENNEVGIDTKEDVQLPWNKVSEVNFNLRPEFPHFYGDVLRKFDNKLIAGVDIEFRDAVDNQLVWEGNTNEYGEYRTPRLEHGSYEVKFSKKDYEDTTVFLDTLADTGVEYRQLLKASPVALKINVRDSEDDSELSAINIGWEHKELPVSGLGITDQSGNYLEEELYWGEYELFAWSSGYDTLLTTTILPVGGKEDTIVLELNRLADLTVIVEEFDSADPVADAAVQVVEHPGQFFQNTITEITDSAGRAYFYTISPDVELLSVAKTGYETKNENISLQPGDTTVKTVIIRPYGSVDGIITSNVDGSAIKNAQIKAVRDGEVIKTVTSDVGGYYSIDEVGIGNYELEVSKADYEDTTVAGVTITRAGAAKNIGLDRQAIVYGQVFDERNDNPIEEAQVKAVHDTEGLITTVETDVLGNYEIKGIPPGFVQVTASHGNYSPAQISINVAYNLRYEENFYLESGSVEGVISSNLDGSGVSEATVKLMDSGGVIKEVTTNSSGYYFIGGVPVGAYDLVFQKENYEEKIIQSIMLPKDGTTRDVSMDRWPIVEGTIRDKEDSASIGEAQVLITHVSQGQIASVETDGQGEYYVPAVPPGESLIEASHLNYGPVEETVQLELNTVHIQDFGLEKGDGFLDGKILNYFTGKGVYNADVKVKQDGIVMGTSSTNSSGDYSKFQLQAGNYVLHAVSNNYLPDSAEVIVQVDETSQQNLYLRSYRDIEVHVTNSETGEPVGGTVITISGPGGTETKNPPTSKTVFYNRKPRESYTISVEDGSSHLIYLSDTTDDRYVVSATYTPPDD